MSKKVKLGEILVKEKVISKDELDKALAIHQTDGRKIGQILVELGCASEEEILSHLALQLGVPYVKLGSYDLKQEIISLIPLEMAQKHNVIPIDTVGRYLTVAMFDPLDDELVEQLEANTNMSIQVVAATSEDISGAIDKYYLGDSTMDDASDEEEVIQTDTNPVDAINAAIEELKAEDAKIEKGQKLERKYRQLLPTVSLPATVNDRFASPLRSEQHEPLEPSSLEGVSLDSPDNFRPPEYTIENFIAGQHVDAVLQAVVKVCESDAPTYNPLFICSSVGLGKTHILKAIANYIETNKPHIKVKYVNCRRLSVQFLNASKNELTDEFFNSYFEADMLLFDDVHLLALDRQAQETFVYIFDEIIDDGKQLVLTGDTALLSSSPGTNGYKFEESLLSRLQSGLTLKIEPPSLETRVNILQKALDSKGHRLPYEMLTFIAHQTPTDVRKLLATLNKMLFLL